MMIRRIRFNLNLVLGSVLAIALFPACKTTPESQQAKMVATLSLHQELNRDALGSTEEIAINRDHPIMLTVAKEPFLTESHVKEAKVVDVLGGFALRIQFDRQGSWLLEQFSASSRGRHIAIFSQFEMPPEIKLNQGRWLAAPKIVNHITDGVLVFTPDATREETEDIARELNNVYQKIQSREDIKME